MPTSRPILPLRLDDRNARNAVRAHQRPRLGERGVGPDRDRIDHHAGLEFLHLPHLLGLFGRCEIAVDDADAARLRHGNGEPRFGHSIHRRRENRDIEVDVAGNARGQIGLAGQHFRMARLKQHVVESQGECAGCGFDNLRHCLASKRGAGAEPLAGAGFPSPHSGLAPARNTSAAAWKAALRGDCTAMDVRQILIPPGNTQPVWTSITDPPAAATGGSTWRGVLSELAGCPRRRLGYM